MESQGKLCDCNRMNQKSPWKGIVVPTASRIGEPPGRVHVLHRP